MAELKLALRRALRVPVQAEAINPTTLAGKSISEVGKVQVWEGNTLTTLEDLFKIEGELAKDPKEQTVIVEGDLSKARRIGARMSAGRMVVRGAAGLLLGEEMSGGSIMVEGVAGSWIGARLKGGSIEVKGDAGDLVGAPVRGSTKGMEAGEILIHGNAGAQLGCYMLNGLIRVKGGVGAFAGVHMQGGEIVIEGDSAGRLGAQMAGGRIVLLGRTPSVLPSFVIQEVRPSIRVGKDKLEGSFYYLEGDVAEDSWKGRLFISAAKNPHLKFLEEHV